MTIVAPARPAELLEEWPVLAACLLGQMLGVHTLPVYTAGLFVVPLHDDLGWSRTSVSAGVMIMTFATAAIAPGVGRLTALVDGRKLIVSGLLALALCYVLLSRVGGSVWSYWLLLLFTALIAAGSSSVVLSRLLVSSFERRRGTALGIALLGTGITSVVAPGLVGSVIANAGWRKADLLLALMVGVGALFVAGLFGLRRRPAAAPLQAHRIGRASGSRPLRLLLAFFLISLGSGGAVIHFVPMLQDAGWGTAAAARSAAWLGASLVLGRLLTGILLDRVDALRLGAFLMAVSATGFALMIFARGGMLLALAPVVGTSMGADLDLMPFLAAREVGVARFGRVYGFFYAAFLVGAGASTLVYALLEHATGDYRLAFAWSGALVGCGAWLLAPGPASRRSIECDGFVKAAAILGKIG